MENKEEGTATNRYIKHHALYKFDINNRDVTMTPLTSMYLLCLEGSSPTQGQQSLAPSNMNIFFHTLYQINIIALG